MAIAFGQVEGRALSWDFGDGSPRAVGVQPRHAFAKGGRYVVQGYDEDFLAERVEVSVVPRPVARAVPQDAEALVWAPSLKDDLGPTVDFLERVAGPGNAQRALEQTWLPALAVELSSGDGSVVDPLEGVGVLMLPGFDGQIALLGVVDGDKAMAALAQKLIAGGAEEDPKTDDGLRLFVAGWGNAVAFVDRGYLYLVLPDPEAGAHEVLKIAERIRASPTLGLTAYAPFTEASTALAEGSLCVWAREARMVPRGSKPALIQSMMGNLHLGSRSATFEAKVRTARPVPRNPNAAQMFARAAEGPVAALKVSLPPAELSDVLLSPPGTGGKPNILRRLEATGVDTTAAVEAFTGEIGALAWFDAEGFLRNVVSGGKPEWRGVLHLIAGIHARDPIAPMLSVLLGDAVHAPYADDRDALLWQRKLSASTVTVALTPKALMIRSGDGSGPRTNADLAQELTERFKGAFGPGHTSFMVDVARLRKELEQPRMIPGLDATKVVMAQGLSAAFLEGLPIETLVVDFEPDGMGGRLWGMVTLKEKDRPSR